MSISALPRSPPRGENFFYCESGIFRSHMQISLESSIDVITAAAASSLSFPRPRFLRRRPQLLLGLVCIVDVYQGMSLLLPPPPLSLPQLSPAMQQQQQHLRTPAVK